MTKFVIKNNEVLVNRRINDLDRFAIEVIEIIEKYTKYVIIAGYVAIFFGRSRATEDIDMFIKEMSYADFESMYTEFVEKGFEFTVENPKSLYEDYLNDNSAINVWKKDLPLLRMEIKLAIKSSQKIALENPIKAHIENKIILFAGIESQIAYKRYISASEKDLEDARHLELVFECLNKEKIKYFRYLFEKE